MSTTTVGIDYHGGPYDGATVRQVVETGRGPQLQPGYLPVPAEHGRYRAVWETPRTGRRRACRIDRCLGAGCPNKQARKKP